METSKSRIRTIIPWENLNINSKILPSFINLIFPPASIGLKPIQNNNAIQQYYLTFILENILFNKSKTSEILVGSVFIESFSSINKAIKRASNTIIIPKNNKYPVSVNKGSSLSWEYIYLLQNFLEFSNMKITELKKTPLF